MKLNVKEIYRLYKTITCTGRTEYPRHSGALKESGIFMAALVKLFTNINYYGYEPVKYYIEPLQLGILTVNSDGITWRGGGVLLCYTVTCKG